jgi:peptidoglycan/xylan/chitin deacetylase (PgdA/CDA1 family)
MLTFDLDAELVWLDMDPGNKERPKTLSIGEYGPRRGVRRILDVLDRYDIQCSWMVPGANAVKYADVVREIAERGHEVGNHGYHHENFGLLDRERQRDVLLRGNEAIEKVTGSRPVGYRTPAGDMTSDTPELLSELGFAWSSSMRGDDRPYFIEVDGKPTSVVEIAAHWELDDFPYFMFNYFPPFPAGQGRIAAYSQVLDIWKNEFDAYHDLGLCFVIMFHPQTIGTPGRIQLLEQLLDHMKSEDGVWFAKGAEVADWWRQLARPNDAGHPARVFANVRPR